MLGLLLAAVPIFDRVEPIDVRTGVIQLSTVEAPLLEVPEGDASTWRETRFARLYAIKFQLETRRRETVELEDRGAMVVSAGTSASPGGRAADEAISIMQERGLDLSAHESQPLDERLVQFADVIITMTRGHRDTIIACYPQAASRTFVLSRGRGDVADPIGGPPELYRRCAEQIDAYLAEWVEEIDLQGDG